MHRITYKNDYFTYNLKNTKLIKKNSKLRFLEKWHIISNLNTDCFNEVMLITEKMVAMMEMEALQQEFPIHCNEIDIRS